MSFSGVFRSRCIPRITGIILMMASLLVLPACWVYSVEPLYQEDPSPDPDLTFDASLLGSWTRIDDKCLWTLTIAADQQTYALTFAPAPDCKGEKATRYKGHLVKLGDHRFLDISPLPDDVCEVCLPLHSFMLLLLENSSLTLIGADGDWLLQAMKEKRVALAHLEGKEQEMVLTASSKELKDFVRKYADDKAVFKPDSSDTVRFKRR